MAVTRDRWEVNVGDEVWVHYGRSWSLATVEKIGSKLIYLYGNKAYYLKDGRRRDGYSGSFMTQAHRADHSTRVALLNVLRDTYGIDISWSFKQKWSTAALESLVSSIDEIDKNHKIYDKS